MNRLNWLKENLIKLRFIVDRLSLRERILLLLGSLIVIWGIWNYLIYQPQKRTNERIIQETLALETVTQALEQKRISIERMVQDNTVLKLLAKYRFLQNAMNRLDEQIARYEQRFIGEKELGNLLYSLLEQTPGVSIEKFSNVELSKDQPSEAIDPSSLGGVVSQTLPASAASSATSSNTPVATPPPAINLGVQEEPTDRTQYTLKLQGDYFAILNYLRRMEQLEWQLYWDKLDYEVLNWPQATATIEFYTLRPVNGMNDIPISETGQ